MLDNGLYKIDNGVVVLYKGEILYQFEELDDFELEYLYQSPFRNKINKLLPNDPYIQDLKEFKEKDSKRRIKPFDTNKEYKDYIKSKEWKLKRKSKLEAVNSCEMCGSEEDLQVHHLTYERFKNEDLEDLQVLCKSCHMEIHGRKF